MSSGQILSSATSPSSGAKARHEANKKYLAQSHVAEILNDMVTLLVCSKPQDELEALIYFLEQRQEHGEGHAHHSHHQQKAVVPTTTTTTTTNFSPKPPAAAVHSDEKVSTGDSVKPSSPLSGQTFRRKNFGASPTSASLNATITTTSTSNNNDENKTNSVVLLLDDVEVVDNNLDNNLSTFELVFKFCLNDDIVFEQLLPPQTFTNRTVDEIKTLVSSSSSSSSREMIIGALENNQKMLQNALLLVSTELAVDKSLLHGSLQKKTSTLSRELMRSNARGMTNESSENENNDVVGDSKLTRLITSLEQRIARSAALKSVVVAASSSQTKQQDLSFLTSTIFFLEADKKSSSNNNNSSKTHNKEDSSLLISSSTEIDLLLSEFIANAQIAIQVLEQQHQLASKKEICDDNNNNNISPLVSQTQIAQWIQQSLSSIEIATKLRENHRRIFMNHDQQEQRQYSDENGNRNFIDLDDEENKIESSGVTKEQFETLRMISPSCGVTAATISQKQQQQGIRDFVSEGRKFIKEWIHSDLHKVVTMTTNSI